MVTRTPGPFDYYKDKHAGVTGDSIRTAADTPGTHAGNVGKIADSLSGDEKKAVTSTEGDISAGVAANPKVAHATATKLAAKGQYAAGCLRLFGADVDTFDTTVNGINVDYATNVRTGKQSPTHDSSQDATLEKSAKNSLEPRYTAADGKLDTDARAVSTKLKQGPTAANVRALIRAGLIPLSAASYYPGLKLTAADKRAYYKSLFKTMTPQQQAAYIKEHAKTLTPGQAAQASPAAKQLIADDVSKDIKDQKIDDETVRLLGLLKSDHPFAHELYTKVSPEEMADAIKHINDDVYSHGYPSSHADNDKEKFYRDFLAAAGATFATYTKGTGSYSPPSNLSDTWYKAITSDKEGQGAALTLLLRAGGHETSYDGHFLSDLTDRVYDWEKDQDGPVWGPRNDTTGVINPFGTNDDRYRYATDGMANLLGAMEHSPDAAQQFFSNDDGHVDDDKLKYLLTERTFSEDRRSDEGDGLGSALRAAAVGDRDHGETVPGTNIPKDEWSASFTSDVFKTIADKSGTGDDFGPDDKWHIWPDMADDLGTIAAGYKSDVYDIIDGAPNTGPSHLDISGGDFDKLLGEIGRGDKTGIETLSASIMIEGNDRINDAIVDWKHEHPGQPLTMDSLADSGLGLALQGRGSTNGEILGHILNKSVLVDLDDEDLAKTRAAYVSKAIDVAGGFIPGAGSVLGEGASDLAKSAFDTTKGQGLDLLKHAVEGTPSATADEYRNQGRDTTSTALEYNVLNQLVRNGYLGDQHPGQHDANVDHSPAIPKSLLVDGPDGTKVVNPGLYDADGSKTIGKDGQYTPDQVREMQKDWKSWMNSQERNIAEGVTGQAQDGFDREVNKGP